MLKSSRPTSTVQVPKKGASKRNRAQLGRSCYPVYLILSERQRNDINFAIPVLEHINIEGSSVLADRSYDSQNLIDYIYENVGEPTIPSKKGAKFERRCD
ncbi:hypothetical protein IMSAG185_00471 [Lachnospiraceae bacterium]|nr:hypothetical protein IMSAG185_00471 [Lachnospiraceae bacterium]